MVEKVNTEQFDKLISGDTPVVCDFYATWCGPCKMLAPVMEKCSEKYDGKAKFVKVDVDESIELAARYGVMSIPLVAVFKKGELVEKSLGFTPQSETEEFIEGCI
ncbi:MAG: thioredoxin [Clostridia bacterium]|nr:thioredoxin [Clostridia bacterium]